MVYKKAVEEGPVGFYEILIGGRCIKAPAALV
jgi:hypothetical protein